MDAKAGFEKVRADPGLGTIARGVGLLMGNVVVQLMREILSRVCGIEEHFWKPPIHRIRLMQLPRRSQPAGFMVGGADEDTVGGIAVEEV